MVSGERGKDRARPGVLAALGLVGALAVATLVLRPEGGLLRSGQGPLGHMGVVAVASSVAWTLGAMRVVERLRPRIATDRGAPSVREERLRRAAVPLLMAGPVVIGVLALVMHRFNRRSASTTPPHSRHSQGRSDVTSPTTPQPPSPRAGRRAGRCRTA
ncbi:hypothetical protein AB0896_17600 [Streptomyces parvulus]|uniref:hypothetical protein n=1 Tax=Streptomyces parvulus TaxID=146923 RepID=UPI0034568127